MYMLLTIKIDLYFEYQSHRLTFKGFLLLYFIDRFFSFKAMYDASPQLFSVPFKINIKS